MGEEIAIAEKHGVLSGGDTTGRAWSRARSAFGHHL